MVLKILYAIGSTILPAEYYTHVVLTVVGIVTVYTFAQGRKTDRERDLHGRTILITGAFTPNGLTLLDSLAKRGAHIMALTSEPPDTGASAVLVSLLRSTTSNENIYAEHCDLTSPASIRTFCDNYRKSEQRLDAVIFAHEYAPIGNILSHQSLDLQRQRQTASCATFLFVTLLLPLLLAAPVERDIRLITLVNPFYAAAARVFSASRPSSSSSSLFLTEGWRALRTMVLMRHLQRVLDALPSGSQVPRTDVNSQSIPVVSDKVQRSNIVAATVSPGISRTDVIAPLLAADSSRGSVSWGGSMYILLNPLLRILTKSPISTLQSTLHALFLPTPFKINLDDTRKRSPEEVLKPGALYAECAVAVVPIGIPVSSLPSVEVEERSDENAKESRRSLGGNLTRPDDGELGGVALGMQVWDDYERELKIWEAEEKARQTEIASES
ncbi:hypothetical protein B0F90DRAFT_1836626 [Multifurca ochricompacta]|uniref:Ketoreductase (KR) domain-containing protein n=1 Tax=Multifurca ochricompacta TaxID=376703 RepID=A0AAD4M569_9AGAM|nr:hypothetical protein B0F90DRAFT_1836626 [Multifurca ochricompacta]